MPSHTKSERKKRKRKLPLDPLGNVRETEMKRLGLTRKKRKKKKKR